MLHKGMYCPVFCSAAWHTYMQKEITVGKRKARLKSGMN